eukprot:4538447-Karenia_brevis.AAC.1
MDACTKHVRSHVRMLAASRRIQLRRISQAGIFERLLQRERLNSKSKTACLLNFARSPCPPLHVALNWIAQDSHRNAVVNLFVGGWLLSRYCCNYYCRSFLPAERDVDAGLEFQREQICIHCWYYYHQIHLESESHVLNYCPLYDKARHDLFAQLDLGGCNDWRSIPDPVGTLVFCSRSPAAWQYFGLYAFRVRQLKRREKKKFE